MSSHSNANSASMPLYHNANPSANPPQNIQLPYPGPSGDQSYHASASVPAEYQQSELVPLYTQHPNEQLHSLSSSMPMSITRYSGSGVNAANAGAMQMGPSVIDVSNVPVAALRTPYTFSNYSPANAIPPLDMTIEAGSQGGIDSVGGANVDTSRNNDDLSLNYLVREEVLLAADSQHDSQQTSNVLIFSTITKSGSGASSAFLETSQGAMSRNSFRLKSTYTHSSHTG